MSPLARSLLALACAALLHASTADMRAQLPKFNSTEDATVAYLKQGILDDKHATKHEIQTFLVRPKNDTDFVFDVPNVRLAIQNESLIGQELWVLGEAVQITLEPETQGKHSPIRAHCEPRCIGSLAILSDQYVIPKLL